MIKLIAGLGNPGRKFKKTRHNFGFLVLDAWAKKHQLDFFMEAKFESEIAILKNNQLTPDRQEIIINQLSLRGARASARATRQSILGDSKRIDCFAPLRSARNDSSTQRPLSSVISKDKIILAKPQTMMNNSGQAIKKISQYYKIKAEEILIVHDDLDLLFGQMKFCFGRGSAGHRGVASIIENLGTKAFFRLRLGIKLEVVPVRPPAEKFVLAKFSRQEKKQLSAVIKKAFEIISAAINSDKAI